MSTDKKSISANQLDQPNQCSITPKMIIRNPRPNPYIGPRSFEQGELLYGRDTETRKLANLLGAERIVLLHSPSGAGKTSLIQAALIPQMEKRKFHVRHIARVNRDVSIDSPMFPSTSSGNAAHSGNAAARSLSLSKGTFRPERNSPALPGGESVGYNRYIFSVLSSLESAWPEQEQIPETELAGMTLAAYLERRPKPASASFELFVFDQFEEILTLDPTDQQTKRAFFAQIGELLEDRDRWALFSMREDFLGALDPYLIPLPNRLSVTFRLDLLGVAAACQAMQKPAQAAGAEFDDAAAQTLADDLRRVQVQRPDGAFEPQLGQHIEPVQLQVVCYRLWESLTPDNRLIDCGDLAALGDVGHALAEYYAGRVAVIAVESGTRERAIREWCDRKLITESGIRGQVLMERAQSAGLDNRAVRLLENAHLVRAEKRGGATWYELAHDRLIEPVRQNNADWFEQHLSVLQRQAALWASQNRSSGLLLRANALTEAENWAAEHADELLPIERDFLTACRDAKAQARRERRKNQFIQGLAVVALGCLCVAIYFFIQANAQRKAAEQQSRLAIIRSLVAYALQDNFQDQRERAALLARHAYLLLPKERDIGNVQEQIDNALRTIFRTASIIEEPNREMPLVDQVCQKVKLTTALTPEEWTQLAGTGIPYEPACPELRNPHPLQLRREKIVAAEMKALSLNLREDSGYGYPIRHIDNRFEDRGVVIFDTATGLTWQQSGSDKPLIYADAQAYIEQLNAQNFAGFNDWRLPTIEELLSLLEKERNSDSLYIDPRFDKTQLWVWSVDIKQIKGENSTGSVWVVYFRNERVYWHYLSSQSSVRGVRS